MPLDRAKPDGETIELALARRPAGGDSKGVLLTNPGGPGGSTTTTVPGGSTTTTVPGEGEPSPVPPPATPIVEPPDETA